MLNARENKRKHAKKKLRCKKDFIDLEARNSFKLKKVVTSMIKCSTRHNHYGLRDAMINNDMVEATCLQCNCMET